MATVFVSYSQKDKDRVLGLVDQIRTAGHDVRIDESFLQIGDSLTLEIQHGIKDVDYCVVFLSNNSIMSKWVRQELHEILFLEFETKRIRLLPCLLEPVDSQKLPNALNKLKQYERLCLDFYNDKEIAVKTLLLRLENHNRTIFQNENYFHLKIPVQNLEIYMTGEMCRWGRSEEFKYFEMLNGYLLFGFQKEPWTYFKHFVLCEGQDAESIRGKLQNAGFLVTGTGDRDPSTGKRRIWFSVCDLPMEGPDHNNMWPV